MQCLGDIVKMAIEKNKIIHRLHCRSKSSIRNCIITLLIYQFQFCPQSNCNYVRPWPRSWMFFWAIKNYAVVGYDANVSLHFWPNFLDNPCGQFFQQTSPRVSGNAHCIPYFLAYMYVSSKHNCYIRTLSQCISKQ